MVFVSQINSLLSREHLYLVRLKVHPTESSVSNRLNSTCLGTSVRTGHLRRGASWFYSGGRGHRLDKILQFI